MTRILSLRAPQKSRIMNRGFSFMHFRQICSKLKKKKVISFTLASSGQRQQLHGVQGFRGLSPALLSAGPFWSALPPSDKLAGAGSAAFRAGAQGHPGRNYLEPLKTAHPDPSSNSSLSSCKGAEGLIS